MFAKKKYDTVQISIANTCPFSGKAFDYGDGYTIS